jgi:uncharacterized YceG family protein
VTDAGGLPPRGRHSSSDGPFSPGFDAGFDGRGLDVPALGTPRYEPARYDPPTWKPAIPSDTAGFRQVSGLLHRHPDETGPMVEPDWWSYGSSDDPHYPAASRHGRPDEGGGWGQDSWQTGHPGDEPRVHPSAPLPPLPTGAWDRLRPRQPHDGDNASTVAQPLIPSTPLDSGRDGEHTAGSVGGPAAGDDETDAQHLDPGDWEDQTGGLEVIGAHVEEAPPRGRQSRRARREAAEAAQAREAHAATERPATRPDDVFEDGPEAVDADALVHDEEFGEDIPVKPYDPRSARARRRRRPFAVLVALLVLAGVVVGIVVGGQKLLTMIDPSSRDYTGQGTGSVEIRVQEGDTLSDIGRTLVDAGVIASVGPFVDAAEANASSVGIQPGVYGMRQQMSGQAALDLMLDPVARLLSRVTLPEGLTVQRTFAKLAEETGRPVAEFEAAAVDTAALGLPPYANGLLEGFLFPATYDVEPDTAPADILRMMITRSQQALDELQIPVEQRLTVLTKASLVQAEASTAEDMAKVARVLENRLADGMPLQLDTTVNYANGKGGITTTPQDRANPSAYNTYVHAGLPPGAISNPGEEAMRAVLSPAPGEWRFFVVVDPDTGDTRFGVTAEEHAQNVLLFQQWLREHPED